MIHEEIITHYDAVIVALSPAPQQQVVQQPQVGAGQFTSESGFASVFGSSQQPSPMSGM